MKNGSLLFPSAVIVGFLCVFSFFRGKTCESEVKMNARDLPQTTQMETPEISDEAALEIAMHSFFLFPPASDPPPVIQRSAENTVVYLPKRLGNDESQRNFPDDWVAVWIDNETEQVIPSPKSVLSEKKALEIARKSIGNRVYDKGGAIKTDRNSTFFVFTFPEPSHGKPGTYLGPDFAAKVAIDSETGKVLFVLFGG